MLGHGVTVSVGLLQVNTENAQLFHLRPEQLFEPCTNTQVVIDSFTLLSRRPASLPSEAAPDPAAESGAAPISVEADIGTELTDGSPF